MAGFMDRSGTDDKCEAALIAARWASGFVCPACDGAARTSFRRQGRLYWQCGSCQRQCSVTSGTVFESGELPPTRRFLAMHRLTQAKNKVSALELKRHLGVCWRTAWRVKHTRLEVMCQREEGRRLTGRVEMDDAELAGERAGTARGTRPTTNSSTPRSPATRLKRVVNAAFRLANMPTSAEAGKFVKLD